MAKKRKLSNLEMLYIKEHTNLSVAELMSNLEGVDEKEVEILVNHYKNVQSPKKVHDPDAFIAGNLMQRREGIVVMTKEAAELGDARKSLAVKVDPDYAKRKADMIHTIK